MIPVFAYGPGGELFRGIYENTDIFFKVKALLGL
jgi:alkaline phosphatase